MATPARQIVRCSKGHLFLTSWYWWGSMKAVRLGPVRYQRCPICRHARLVRKVDGNSLTPSQREQAEQFDATGIL